MMPISSTAPISAFSPGLAKNATMICLYSTNRINAHNTRNTTIRTTKIRGDDSFVSSISMAERAAPGGMRQESGFGKDRFGPQYGTATAGKQTGTVVRRCLFEGVNIRELPNGETSRPMIGTAGLGGI